MKPGTVFITGAARRIGRALALDFAERGWNVALHYRLSKDAATDVAEEISAMGRKVLLLQADLAVEKEVAPLMKRAREKLGPITCLINNASVFERDSIEDMSRESWDMHMEPNLRAPALLSQQFAAQLPDDMDGLIINLLDQRVLNPNDFFFSYTITKCALHTMNRTMALALAPRVRVNAIAPGAALKAKQQATDHFERLRKSVPLQKAGGPAEICHLARFLVEADTVTGQVIAVDGGEHLGWSLPDPSLKEEHQGF